MKRSLRANPVNSKRNTFIAISYNKPFKAHCTDSYDDWLAKKRLNDETACGNPRLFYLSLIE